MKDTRLIVRFNAQLPPPATWLCCLLLLTGSCSRPSALAVELSSYVERLGRSLEEDLPHGAQPSPVRLPRVRDLQVDLPADSINLLEFLKLYECELHQVIAERNSSLGRLAPPSEELIFTARFLATVDACIKVLHKNDDNNKVLQHKLREARSSKIAALPIYLWRATLGGEEFRDFWQPRHDDAFDPDVADVQVEIALSRLQQITEKLLSGDYGLDSAVFYDALQHLQSGEGGALLNAWLITGSTLSTANQILASRLARRPLCFGTMVTPKARIFRNVVLDGFVSGVQPTVAALNRRHYAVMEQVQSLEMLLEAHEPPAYRQYRQARDTQYNQARQSVVDHVAATTPLFEQCGFLPGRDA